MHDEPTPIPESITYDGENLRDVIDWAHRTLNHYERPLHEAQFEGIRTPTPILNGIALEPGTAVTFDDRAMRFAPADPPWMDANGPVPRERQFAPGPEILARDHPQTLSEAQRVQNAQRKLGVLPPESSMTFTQRRALAESMARHPSGAGGSATQYTLPTSPVPAATVRPHQGIRPV